MFETVSNSENITVNENFWYTAQTDLGAIYIGIDRKYVEINSHENVLPVILQKAIILRKGEALIRHIEDWLKCGLELCPATIIPNSIYTIVFHSKSTGTDEEVNSITLGIQHMQLDKLSDPTPSLLKIICFDTCCIPIQFVLSEFHIVNEQYELIDDGRILLIPDSYSDNWKIKLRNRKNPNMCLIGKLNSDIRTLIITDQSVTGKANKEKITSMVKQENQHLLTVTLRDDIPISLDLLLGWNKENTLLLDHSLRHYKADVWCDSNLIASGYLISVADGYGLNIKTHTVEP